MDLKLAWLRPLLKTRRSQYQLGDDRNHLLSAQGKVKPESITVIKMDKNPTNETATDLGGPGAPDSNAGEALDTEMGNASNANITGD
ncbi:hypothetical protein CPLU01_12993 [Colletotrichum plurivorum]|uniref:Uncharacterized protein n=1 Tax=Colletotrichum plurivorum TaxID=2175906 RepID=A0A8H6JVL6_9PEZI|nr:hypothetical protein CPLU01_12993 [Colletotrichum plurivorum]